MSSHNPKKLIGRLAVTAAGLVLLASAGFAQATFTDVSVAAGVQFHQESETLVPIGGGGGWADFNNDGLIDLYVPQATGCNKLFRNMGGGSFAEVPNAAGAADCAGVSHGLAVADVDNDGDQDLYVTNHGQNRMFKNLLIENGFVQFQDITVSGGFDNDGAANSASASWGDFDNDGLLDLAVVNHSDFVPIDLELGSCKKDLVYHNQGGGVFVEVGEDLGIANSGRTEAPGCGLAVTWSDYDNDGDADLWVVNDFGEVNVMNKLFRNDGPGGIVWKFSDQSRWAAVDYPMFGMGISVGDINRDGLYDYYTSDIGPNNMALNSVGGTFSEIASLSRTMASDRAEYGGSGLVSWGSAFFDINGDGYEELFVANGGAPEDKWPMMFGPDYEDFNPIYAYGNLRNLKFIEAHGAIGLSDTGFYRSLAVADYDGDGDLDIHAGVLQGNNHLYRNDTPVTFNWLKVKPVGTTSNRDAIGARVSVEANGSRQVREIDGGSGFLSRHAPEAYFGLGSLAQVDRVVVRFPSGTVVEVTGVAVNQTLEVVE